MCLLSIIVPTYNVEQFIGNCLDSLLDQDISKEDYEILVINDGATDRSAEIVATYTERYENVTLVNQENKGLSGARNTGIPLAKGKYTYFIDSDDYIARNTLGLIISILEKLQLDFLGVGVLETGSLDIKESSNHSDITTSNPKTSDGIAFIADHYYLNNAWWYFINTEFLRRTKLVFPEGRLVEDANFTSKLLVAANRVAHIPLDFYRYYMRPNSIMRKTNIDHVRRLLGDYERNVFEFNEQIKELRTNEHPRIGDCLERIEARQQSFAFFQLIKSIRYGLPRKEVTATIKRFEDIQVYPLKKFLGKDYNKTIYKILVPILNRKGLFLAFLSLRNVFR
ncbi:MAG: hypothetical protein Mars2KO_10210 [Maribacter sp.]|uniref:glycosyltransferase n=1 Tax=Maribacter sp. 2307UL18-2 TaxID=3386274 RepID=UPI0039BD15D3